MMTECHCKRAERFDEKGEPWCCGGTLCKPKGKSDRQLAEDAEARILGQLRRVPYDSLDSATITYLKRGNRITMS